MKILIADDEGYILEDLWVPVPPNPNNPDAAEAILSRKIGEYLRDTYAAEDREQ